MTVKLMSISANFTGILYHEPLSQTAKFSGLLGPAPEPISPDCNNLFLTQGGKPITVNTVKLLFSRLAKRAGVKRLHAHLCRHTFAINYLMNGGDIFSLREIIGHTTLDMVNHYLHFTSSQITARHQKYSPMDKLFYKGEKSIQQ